MTESKMSTFLIEFEPIGRRVEVKGGTSLLGAAQQAGAGLLSLCGGEGWCNSCLVRIVRGKTNPPSPAEVDHVGQANLEDGYRLACQTIPESDLVVDIPPESLSTPQRLQVEGQDSEISLSPGVKAVDLELVPPALDDLRADAERVIDSLDPSEGEKPRIGLPVLISLSDQLRKNKWKVRLAVSQDEVIAVLPFQKALFGIAADIGTTKIAVYLIDLSTGLVVEKTGEMNPQIAYGEDIISRISYTMQHPDGREKLQRIVVDTLNKIISDFSNRLEIRADQIVDAVIVGNTAMHHLLIGLPVDQLVYAPYVPAVNQALDIRAVAIGLKIAPGAFIHFLPNIAGYVGADHAAVILSTELWKMDKTSLAIDIGTNTELTLVFNGRLLSCSCASGPAFEGAHIKDGMRAAPGAIERVQIVDGEVRLYTINNEPPVGICGSGILDVVAALKSAGMMDEKGALIKGQPRVRMNDKNVPEFLLAPASSTGHNREITVSRKDINEIQLAKAAIRAGQEILLKKAGITPADLNEVIIAGAFGTYIDVPNAIQIGMFPELPLDRFHQIGNAAGMGAIQALLSVEKRELIQQVIGDVEYLELTTYEDFQKEFVKAMYLR